MIAFAIIQMSDIQPSPPLLPSPQRRSCPHHNPPQTTPQNMCDAELLLKKATDQKRSRGGARRRAKTTECSTDEPLPAKTALMATETQDVITTTVTKTVTRCRRVTAQAKTVTRMKTMAKFQSTESQGAATPTQTAPEPTTTPGRPAGKKRRNHRSQEKRKCKCVAI